MACIINEQTTDRFAQFARFLRSLEDQLEDLQRLNGEMSNGVRVPTEWLTNLDASSNHVQSVRNLESLFVVRDTLKETWDFNVMLMKLTHPKVQTCWFGTGETQLRLDPTARVYEPGVHRVRINVVDSWSLDDGRSVTTMRRCAIRQGQKLVACEVIGALGLHPKLLRMQDGVNLPYLVLAGFQQGHHFDKTPVLAWDKSGEELAFLRTTSDYVDPRYAAASLL